MYSHVILLAFLGGIGVGLLLAWTIFEAIKGEN